MVTALLAAVLLGDASSDRAQLLAGVESISSPGIPGVVAPVGASSFTVAQGKSGRAPVPVVAAGTYGKGRMVVFGHNGYLGAFADAGTGRLLANAARWAGGGGKVLVVRQASLARHLASQGLEASQVASAANLGGANMAVVLDAREITRENVPELRRFVAEGGGIVTAATGWGWQQLNGDKPLSELPANDLLIAAGLVVTGGMADPARPGRMDPATGPTEQLNAWHGLRRLLDGSNAAAEADVTLITFATASLPAGPSPFRTALVQAEQATTANRSLPIGKNRPLDRLMLALETQRASTAPVAKITASATAAKFPGSVPASAQRGSNTISLPTGQTGWLSTGLYAAPGERIVVRMPEAGWTARIGAHSDGIWHLDRWERAPEVSRSFPLSQGETVIASAHGGLVYLIPRAGSSRAKSAVIEGAVPAPRFIRGQTTAAAWRRQRLNPGPWAEIEGDRIIHTIPSAWVRELDNPEEVAAFWDKVTDACADLAQTPRERRRKERIVADVQISAGYMHAGYPIMTHLDTKDRVLNLEVLRREGSWGHFHEIGHNHQNGDWTFDGTVEVTVNLFTLYVYDTVLGMRPEDRSFRAQQLAANWKKFSDGGWTFDRWKGDPFMALTVYMQMQERFGWDMYKKVFREYLALPPGERPRNDAEKRSQWLTRFSRAAGVNLSPLFADWKIPVSSSAVSSLSGLPAWRR